MKTTDFSTAARDLIDTLSLDKLRNLIEPFRKEKFLIGITCRPEFYDALTQDVIFKQMDAADPYYSKPNSYCGINLSIVNSQEEPVKYWHNNQEKELREYLKNNV